MAESAASFLFNHLTLFLQQEQELLRGIGDNAVYIRDELGLMRAFLRAADEKEETDPQLKEWVKKVREITYDIEDVLERYMLKLPHLHRDADGYKRYIKKMYGTAKTSIARHQIASEFQKIKLRMENVAKTQQIFKDIYDFKDQGSSSKTYDTRGDALLLEEEEVVGIEEPKKQLVEWLKQTGDGLMVISVVGMGGLGKTTLVKKIYDDASVKANFDCHAWVTVSENFNLERLLRDMINKLNTEVKLQPPQNLGAMNDDEMKEYVYKFLKNKTYMIVLDDVWKIDVWESIRYAFPRKSTYGRIIITTRLYNIGNAACSETCGHLYNLDPLTAENSEKLFFRKAFPRNSCPSNLNEISKSILKRCEGLPLAIVVIGGLLATKNNNFEEWKMFERTIGLELQGDYLKRLNKLLSISYYDLPYYLKACFLYLSIFPDDYLIDKGEVIRLWIAEGFVEAKGGKTLIEVAEGYLNELLNRSLIQVAETFLDGSPFGFRIHDILRELIISKSRDQNLSIITSEGEMMRPDKIRRVAIHSRFKETEKFDNVKYLRSLFWLGQVEDSKSGLVFHKVLGHCRLLKVLSLRKAPIDSIPNEVFKLYHLKYLNLSGTNIQVIPKSIENLQNLEILDLEYSKVTELPIEILKLSKLWHLIGASNNTTLYPVNFDFNVQGFKAPYEIGSYLTSLQTLGWIDADEADGIKIVQEVGKLTQLRILSITKLRREDGRDLFSSLVKLTNLRWLLISCIKEDEVMDLDHPLSLQFLRLISLNGHLEKLPRWVYSLHGLAVLHLRGSRLREDPLQQLEDLPNLVYLHMSMFAYEGEELIFKGRKFQKLERLNLGKLRGLRCVRVEKDSMPHLKRWHFLDCKLMEELPEGIEHLSDLQHLEITTMSEKFNGRVVEQKHKGGKLAHVPIIKIWDKDVFTGNWRVQQL